MSQNSHARGRGHFRVDLITTTATSIVTAAALLYVTRLFATLHGQDGLGYYVMFRRITAVLVPISSVMIGIGLTRAIAVQRPRVEGPIVAACTLAAIATACITVALLATPVLRSFPNGAAATQNTLAGPVVMFIWAHLLYVIAFAYYRGSDQMRHANILQIVCIAVVPIIAVTLLHGSGDISTPTYFVAASYGLAGFIAIPLIFRSAGKLRRFPGEETARLARYCLPRVPGNLGMTAMLAIAPSFALLTHGIRGAGLLGAAQSAYGVAEAGASALGLLLLPRIAELHAAGRSTEIRSRLSDVTVALTQGGILATFLLAFFASEIIEVWLGREYSAAVILFQVTALSLTPYVLYVALRSAVDAIDERALNTISIGGAFALQSAILALATRFSPHLASYAAGTAVGIIALGTTTLGIVARHSLVSIARFDIMLTTLAAAPLASAIAIIDFEPSWGSFAGKSILAASCTALYFAILVFPKRSRTRALFLQSLPRPTKQR